MIIKAKDKLYEALQAGPWHGLREVKVEEIDTPVNRWSGPKRTLEQHRQVLAFFAWSYEETKSETMVHWFVNLEQNRWEPMVLPQKGYSGMTVKLLEDHENYIPTFQRLGAGWEMMGTDHHHCSYSAFQSGTDHADEKGKEGLHLTIGGLGSQKYSLDSRSSFRQTIRPVLLSDWYEVPEPLRELPVTIQEQALQHLLVQPAVGVSFPEWWKDNVIKVQAVTVYNTNQHPASQYTGGTVYKNRHSTTRLKGELEDFRKSFNMNYTELYEWLLELNTNQHLVELLKLFNYTWADLEDSVECVEEMIQEKIHEQSKNGQNDDTEVVNQAELDRILEANETCRACEGTGVSSRGSTCLACAGTGLRDDFITTGFSQYD